MNHEAVETDTWGHRRSVPRLCPRFWAWQSLRDSLLRSKVFQDAKNPGSTQPTPCSKVEVEYRHCCTLHRLYVCCV